MPPLSWGAKEEAEEVERGVPWQEVAPCPGECPGLPSGPFISPKGSQTASPRALSGGTAELSVSLSPEVPRGVGVFPMGSIWGLKRWLGWACPAP